MVPNPPRRESRTSAGLESRQAAVGSAHSGRDPSLVRSAVLRPREDISNLAYKDLLRLLQDFRSRSRPTPGGQQALKGVYVQELSLLTDGERHNRHQTRRPRDQAEIDLIGSC
uniref:Uncharacterized protein n=1 Tax=Branchiostoma floridae TaxID=7739 RepID=C3YTU7_BRAFL|eukprot:XP_002600212.1 hypothetical protein BRAFLDRAFT_66717 [Branchiostoma floridae]